MFDVGLNAMTLNTHVKVKGLMSLAILAGVVWFGYHTIFSSPFSGEVRHDFGVVPIERPFSVVEHTFRLKNITDHTMRLINVTPTCGCTTTEWPKGPVHSGEELVIPTHLKLQRSQFRSSRIRLEFENGDVVVLFIKGVGRFTQPLTFVQQAMKVSLGDEEGFRGVLKLEWYDNGRPPSPTLEPPDGLRVEVDAWHMTTAADSNKMTPQIWTLILKAYQIAELKDDASLLVKIDGVAELTIPCTEETLNPAPPQIGGSFLQGPRRD